MFYSETLLSKTGPLARVWLASNLDRKLSKTHILQSDIQSSVDAIVSEGQAPMALRLSGQLMLGVARIYGRKARYLLDDCNEALMKIRMTFKNTTNNDLPQTTGPASDLTLPELLTIDDLFPSMDMAFPMSQAPHADSSDATLQDFGRDWTSTLNPNHSTQSELIPNDEPGLLEDDLALDLGDDMGFGNDTSISIQVGREGPAPRPVGEDLFSDDNVIMNGEDLGLDLGEDVPMTDLAPNMNDEDGFPAQDDGMDFVGGDDETLQLRNAVASAKTPGRSESPLSDAGSEALREIDRTFANEEEEIEEIVAKQPQRSKKRKALVSDQETTLRNAQIKAQSEDRSRILRPAAFLPRDPLLLTLMNMQKNGDFVSNVMKDGMSRNWAPELQGLLSFDVVRSSSDRKRKRDSGIADISDDDAHSEKSPRIELPEDDDANEMLPDEGVDFEGDTSLGGAVQFELPADDGIPPPLHSDGLAPEDEEGIYAGDNDFDDTTIPLIHPADNGPVSLGTKHAVNLLRERFGGQDAQSSPVAKKSVLLQELVPEDRTSREDATKMFFEVLVLATKDAIKVEQGNKAVGLPLRIRGKRGLWGAWAEKGAEEDENGEVLGGVGAGASVAVAA